MFVYANREKPFNPAKSAGICSRMSKRVTETAGFEPLEVRFKKMEQAGFRAQFFESDFDSADLREIYLHHPEFTIQEGDELEDVIEKDAMRSAFIRGLLAKKTPRHVNITNDASSKERANNKANDAQDGSIDV